MKLPAFNYFNLGSRLTLTFAVLIAVILGGNGLLIWQFYEARLQTDRLTGASQQVIAILRLQESLLLFHQRLDELAQSEDVHRFVTEAEPLRGTLLEQIRRARNALTHLPPEIRVDPALLPTMEATEITLPSQLEAITELAVSGDWEAVRLRLANGLKPLETQTSALVKSIDQEVSGELSRAVANMRNAQRRIFLLVPATAISTFFIAAFFAWTIAGRIIELRLEERVSERTRIIRELHDTFLQTIQGSKFVADDALEQSDDPVRLRRAMEQLSVWLGQAIQEGRVALNSLRTSTTETNDLAEAFRRATETCRSRGTTKVCFSVVGDARDMHPIVRDEVYRIGYEAIRNACVHSGASRLEVELKYARDLALRVSDNGIGLDAAVAANGKPGHFGLQGMRERAARINSKLTLVSSPTSGTEITVVVPGGMVYRKASAPRFERIKAVFRR